MSVCGGDDIDTLDSKKVKLYKNTVIYINTVVDSKVYKKSTHTSTSESISSNDFNFKKTDESIITTKGLLTCNELKYADNHH